ncbi:N(G),N(G)-dimethylarginine dimethylaminohydrolase [Microbacterium kribbense]|uniref:N(G),N(G)-dimethylarginine dimethylaminohydrolase n=1 Tax=Microbacterium kribbense TaxID=433645 RepID=A0ABP7GFA3_9MICO
MPRRLLVRRPSPRLNEGELTHRPRVDADPQLALAQWEGYVEAFRSRGWDVISLPAADEHPDGVFVEDVVVVFDDIAVITRPGASSRRGEIDSARAQVTATGLTVAAIAAPGTLEGGDVLKIGRTVYVGLSSRTNADGIAQLRAILEPHGWSVVAVPITKVLHLKTGATALPDGAVIGYQPLVDDPTVYDEFVPMPEEEGSAVVVLDEHTVLISASAPGTAAALRARGLEVVAVPVTEFEKLEGCVTCLSVRVRG